MSSPNTEILIFHRKLCHVFQSHNLHSLFKKHHPKYKHFDCVKTLLFL